MLNENPRLSVTKVPREREVTVEFSEMFAQHYCHHVTMKTIVDLEGGICRKWVNNS